MADALAGCKSVLIGHGDDLIIDLGVQHIGDKACADALNLVGTCMAFAEDGRILRLHGNDLHTGLLALEILAHAGQGAAGTDAGHEHVYSAVRILPDLRAGGFKVGLGVGGVYKLAGNEAVGNLLGQLICLGNGTLHALGALGEHQLRAIGLHQLAALHAHGIRHDDDDAVAPCRCHGRKTDAGIAGGRLNNDGAGLQSASCFCVVDHGLGDPVLYGTGGVEVFQLYQNLGLQFLSLFNMGQLQQRGLANQLVSGCINLAHNYFLLYISQWCLFYGTGSRLMNHHIRRRHRNVFIFITNLSRRLIRIICHACWFVNSFF